MYNMEKMQRATAFGVEVANEYENFVNQISLCVPNDVLCFNTLEIKFHHVYNEMAKKYGIDTNDPKMKEHRKFTYNLLKIEYDTQNELYKIDQEYSYSSGYSARTGIDAISSHWQQEYERALADIKANRNP